MLRRPRRSYGVPSHRSNHCFQRSCMGGKNRNHRPALLFSPISLWRNAMMKLGIFGATALSLTLAVASPALAQRGHAGGGGGAAVSAGASAMGGGGMSHGGGGWSGGGVSH